MSSDTGDLDGDGVGDLVMMQFEMPDKTSHAFLSGGASSISEYRHIELPDGHFGPANRSTTTRSSRTSTGTGALSWSATTLSDHDWLQVSPSSGTAPSTITVSALSADLPVGGYDGLITLEGNGAPNSPLTISVRLEVGEPPTFITAGVTNGASFGNDLAPGTIASIFGVGLTSGVNGVVVAEELPLPLELHGTEVTVNGIPAPLFAVANVDGQEQINFQVPYEVDEQPNATIVVTRNGQASLPVMGVPVGPLSPGIFTLDGVNGAITHADGSLVSESNPAHRGEVVVVYATGLGAVDPPVPLGHPSPASPAAVTVATITVHVNGSAVQFVDATVLFSGLTPGFVGLYQALPIDPVFVCTGFRGHDQKCYWWAKF